MGNTLGNPWGHNLYPENPERRERVTELAELLRSNVIQVYTTCVYTSLVLNRFCQDCNVVPPIDLTKTYNENFDIMKATFAQWVKITENLQSGEKVSFRFHPCNVGQLIALELYSSYHEAEHFIMLSPLDFQVTAQTRKLIDDINSATDAKAFSEHRAHGYRTAF